MTTTLNTSLVGNLILSRLLTIKEHTPGKLREDLSLFFRHLPSSEEWQGHLDELAEAGLIRIKPLRLTDAGRAEALAFLGLERLPPRTNWKTVQTRHLVLKALGVDPDDQPVRQRIKDTEGLAAYLLRTRYGLSVAAAAPLDKVLEALACKQVCDELGMPHETTLQDLRDAVLNRVIDSPERLKFDTLRKEVPKRAAGVHVAGRNDLYQAVLIDWLEREGTTGNGRLPGPNGMREMLAQESPDGRSEQVFVPAEDFDLSAFAATVRTVALRCPSGWFGDNKVFISHVWNCLREEAPFRGLDLVAFKARLIEAQHAGLLRLERADLVQAMDPGDVRDSETPYLNAVFHFVLVERDRP